MCGRYSLTTAPEAFRRPFDFDTTPNFAPIYDWFTEGFDTADLKEAKSLLDELY